MHKQIKVLLVVSFLFYGKLYSMDKNKNLSQDEVISLEDSSPSASGSYDHVLTVDEHYSAAVKKLWIQGSLCAGFCLGVPLYLFGNVPAEVAMGMVPTGMVVSTGLIRVVHERCTKKDLNAHNRHLDKSSSESEE